MECFSGGEAKWLGIVMIYFGEKRAGNTDD
jgi:hypothetical protein